MVIATLYRIIISGVKKTVVRMKEFTNKITVLRLSNYQNFLCELFIPSLFNQSVILFFYSEI